MERKSDIEIRPIRTALVGLGGHGGTIQEAALASADLDVVAVFDIVESLRKAASERFGCYAPDSYESLLERPDLEAVVLVTPNHLHRGQAAAAFDAGLDVFLEKPIANTVADGLAIVEAAEGSDRVLMIGHNMRFARATQKAREYLLDGRLGKVVNVEVHFSADNMRRLARDSWRLRAKQCPLLPVMQLGIHGIDLTHYLVGPVRNVFAVGRSVTPGAEVTDSVAAVLEFGGGVTGTLVSNYCSPVLFEYRITGTGGALRCTPQICWFRSTDDTDGRGQGPADVYDYTEYDRESYRLQLDAFARAVRLRKRPEIDGWDGLQALAVVEALHRSTIEGTPQTVEDFGSRRREAAAAGPALKSEERP